MHKKLITACLAIAAFAAFVVAPAASASPVLTHNPAAPTAVPVPSDIHGTNLIEGKRVNAVFTGGFNVTCNEATISGTLTENSGTSIKGEVPVGGATYTGEGGTDCTSALGAVKPTVNSKLCLASIKGTDTLTIDGCGAAITFTLAVTAGPTCKYEAATIVATFTTGMPADGIIHISEQPAKGEAGNSFLCPTEGKLDQTIQPFYKTTPSGALDTTWIS
ncbi:MAG TPA: hypothetical protein VFP21_04105 [Solirubrobacterales bacterium]|nr:hypothetical protein [Solirubrobacterales bacterium]